MLLDTTIQTGDVLAAFLSIRHMLDVPAFFFGLSQNVQHSEWILECIVDVAKELFLDGTLPLNCGTPMPPEPEATKKVISAPQMTLLSWSADKKSVSLPQTIVDQWKPSMKYFPRLE